MLARGVWGAFIGLYIYTFEDGGASSGRVGMLSQPPGARRALRSLQCASIVEIAQRIERALTLPVGPPRPGRLLGSRVVWARPGKVAAPGV